MKEIFWPANSKSLRLRSAAFEMQLTQGVWNSSFKRPPTGRRHVNRPLSQVGFFPKEVNPNNHLCKLLHDNITKRKNMFAKLFPDPGFM